MNDDARDDATEQPIPLKNESTPDDAVFSGTASAPATGIANGAGSVSGGEGGYLLQPDNDDEDFKDDEYFSTEIENYAYLKEG